MAVQMIALRAPMADDLARGGRRAEDRRRRRADRRLRQEHRQARAAARSSPARSSRSRCSPEMGRLAPGMVHDALDAFVARDAEKAAAVCAQAISSVDDYLQQHLPRAADLHDGKSAQHHAGRRICCSSPRISSGSAITRPTSRKWSFSRRPGNGSKSARAAPIRSKGTDAIGERARTDPAEIFALHLKTEYWVSSGETMPMEHVDVIVVGAGISGIGAGYHLQKNCPDRSYVILEGREAMGGTWDLFRYPGIRSDSDMYTLGYAFQPWTEAKAIADGPAILRLSEGNRAELWHRQTHPLSPSRQARRLVDRASAWTVDRDRAGRGRGSIHLQFPLHVLGLLQLRARPYARICGQRGFRRTHRPSAVSGPKSWIMPASASS